MVLSTKDVVDVSREERRLLVAVFFGWVIPEIRLH